MRALAWDEPPAWVTWKVVAAPAGASFHETVKVTPLWVAVAELGVAAAPTVLVFAGSIWVVLVGGAAALLLVDASAAGAFLLAPSSASPASLVVVSA